MGKLKSLEELRQIRNNAKAGTRLRVTGEKADRTILSVGMATCGIAAGARAVMNALADEISKQKLENISVVATGCLGFCYAEPLVVVEIPGKEPIRYANVDANLAGEIIRRHILRGELLEDAILGREVPRGE